MNIIGIAVAALAGWLFGAVWYMSLWKSWAAAARVPLGADGRPVGGSPLPFVISALTLIVVAAMMSHVLASSGIMTLGAGALSGLGIGLFFISPWILLNNTYAMRPLMLTLIDGGYAVFACTIMGGVLVLLS